MSPKNVNPAHNSIPYNSMNGLFGKTCSIVGINSNDFDCAGACCYTSRVDLSTFLLWNSLYRYVLDISLHNVPSLFL